MCVSAITRNKSIEGCYESALTSRVSEIESLQILDKSIRSVHFKALRLSTIVLISGGIELLPCGVGDYLLSTFRGALLGAMGGGLVVVALDEEHEVGSSLPQTVEKRLVVCQSLHVEDVGPDRTEVDREDEVDDHAAAHDADRRGSLKELANAHDHHDYRSDQQDGAGKRRPVLRARNCYRHILLLGQARIQGIIVKGIETAQLLEEVLAGRSHYGIEGRLGSHRRRHVHGVWCERGCVHWIGGERHRWTVEGIGSRLLWEERRLHRSVVVLLGRYHISEWQGWDAHIGLSVWGCDLVIRESISKRGLVRLHMPHFYFPITQLMFGSSDLVFHGLVRLLFSPLDAVVLWLEGVFLVLHKAAAWRGLLWRFWPLAW